MKYLKTDGSYFRFLEQRFPEIKYTPGEDLNIENVKKDIFTRCWKNTERYKKVGDVANVLGLSVTTTYKLAKDYGLSNRARLKYEES